METCRRQRQGAHAGFWSSWKLLRLGRKKPTPCRRGPWQIPPIRHHAPIHLLSPNEAFESNSIWKLEHLPCYVSPVPDKLQTCLGKRGAAVPGAQNLRRRSLSAPLETARRKSRCGYGRPRQISTSRCHETRSVVAVRSACCRHSADAGKHGRAYLSGDLTNRSTPPSLDVA